MSDYTLPSRAKPEVLHKICVHLQESEGVSKKELYNQMEFDRRQIRAALDYGDSLGFLNFDGNTVDLNEAGKVISYNSSIDTDAVRNIFKKAIENYKPYRDGLLWLHVNNQDKKIKGDECFTQSSFKTAVRDTIKGEYSNRQINLLIKTAEVAGLGKFITGRKGIETRLKISVEFGEFIEELEENYDISEISKSNEANDEPDSSNDAKTRNLASVGNDTTSNISENLKLTIELDIGEKSNEEILNLVEKIQNLE